MEASEEDLESIERDLVVLLRRFRAYAAGAARQIDEGLEGSAYGLLIRIKEAGPLRAADLAEHFGVGKPTMSRQLAALEERGLIDRRPNDSDARSSLLALSPAGLERLDAVRADGRRHLRETLGKWDPSEISQLADSLAKLNQRLEWE